MSNQCSASPLFPRRFTRRALCAAAALCSLALVTATPAQSQGRHGHQKNAPTNGWRATIVVFPPETKGGISDQLTDSLTDVVQSRINATGQYQTQYFLTSLPTVRRAILEQTLSNADVSPPYDSDTKVKRLITLAGHTRAITSSIDDIEYDATKQQMTVVISLRYVDFTGEKPVIRSYGDSITGAEKGAKSDKDIKAASDLTRSLTERLMADFLKGISSAASAPKKP
jgi:hypothetical protein